MDRRRQKIRNLETILTPKRKGKKNTHQDVVPRALKGNTDGNLRTHREEGEKETKYDLLLLKRNFEKTLKVYVYWEATIQTF